MLHFVLPFMAAQQDDIPMPETSRQDAVNDARPGPLRSPAISAALWISIIYLAVGLAWIILSDALIASIAARTGDPMGLVTLLQTLKGWIFIFLTAVMLFFILRLYIARVHETERRLRTELEERVAARTADLSRANEQLQADAVQRRQIEAQLRAATQEAQKANVAKSAFLANTSHEIRTPLTSILGYTDLLLDGDLAAELRQRYITVIQQNAAHLLTLIDDLLDLSRTEMGKLAITLADYDPREIVHQTVDLLRPRADEKNLSLTLKLVDRQPATIRTDGVRLRQVLTNLVSNAIKFTAAGEVTVTLECCDEPVTALCFRVSDTGIGIAPEHLPRIFEPFYQVDQGAGRRYGGTGLGLSISRQLTEHMGGTLEVESEPGRGSTFTVRIPLAPAPSTSRSGDIPGQTAAPARVAGHILLAEDNDNVRWLVEEYLRRAGATVTPVADGLAAVAAATVGDPAKVPIDLILMDIHMPGMDGFEAMSRIRAAGYKGPIVALTAHLMANEKERWTEAGCDAVVAKPIDVKTFIPLIARLIQNKTAGQPYNA
jgi:signal transduction histidine kinase/CheY-like chemotaxis protein